jgi:hypothetical protein
MAANCSVTIIIEEYNYCAQDTKYYRQFLTVDLKNTPIVKLANTRQDLEQENQLRTKFVKLNIRWKSPGIHRRNA